MDCKNSSSFSSSSSIDDGGVLSAATAGLDSLRACVIARHAEVLHHLLSMSSIFFSLVSGQAQFYILMVLFTESTTPFINLRWYLDATGQNDSRLYTFNVAVLFLVTNDLSLLSWLIAVDLYIRELDNFRFELSMNSCNDRLSKTHP